MHLLGLGIISCLLPAASALAAQSDFEIVRGTTVERLTMAFTGYIQTPTMMREVNLGMTLPAGRRFNGTLLIAQDTASHRFWWLLQNNPDSSRLDFANWFASHSAVFIDEDKIVVFWDQNPGHLFIAERPGLTAENLDDAQRRAVDEIRQSAAVIEKGGVGLGLGGNTDVPLPSARMSLDFWVPPHQAMAPFGRTRVVSASREGKNWKLILRDQWDQELVLDDSYHFVSTRRLDADKTDVRK